MASNKASGSSQPKLDLTDLKSYSPEWSHTLRLTVAIAVQYACHRCLQRAVAIHKLLYPEDDGVDALGPRQLKRSSLSDDRTDDTIDQAGLVQRDEDGRVLGPLQGWARTQQVKQDREMVEMWREYTQKYLMATCQHLGIAMESLPPGTPSLEDIRSASRGRRTTTEVDGSPSSSDQETEYEMGTSHVSNHNEGTGAQGELLQQEERQDDQADQHQTADGDGSNPIKQETTTEAKAAEVDKELAELNLDDKLDKRQRAGGILSQESTQEIEIVNELLLIALGMGQHRAEDGSTTLFEQEALFGDTEVKNVNKPAPSADDAIDERESALPPDSALGNKAWSALRSGISSIGKAASKGAAELRTDQEQKRTKGPVKPNEMCHYDARARALIFVAVTAMDVYGVQVYMAEKVVAQTIYFIMSEGRSAAKKGGRGDPLDEDGQRHGWMNDASQQAVQREKTKGNWTRWAAMGAGAALGGTLIGVTGGLAAPLVAPALVGLTGVSFLATTGGVMMMATLLGVGGAGLAGHRVQRRLRGIDHFAFRQVNSVAREAGMTIPSLHATICCSGLQLNDDRQGSAFEHAFYRTGDMRDTYVIEAEEAMMKQAGEGLKGYVLETALKSGGQKVGTEVLKHTALAGIAALTLPLTAYSAASAALDGCFVQAKSRAYRAGLILADVLRDEVQGHRPVTLIGTSLGCVTIMTALGALAQDPAAHGHLVDSVYLIGAPFSPSPATLRRARSIVARRFVSAYSRRDMVCSIAAWLGSGISLEEMRAGQMPRIVGSCAMLDVPGVENIDVSDLVGSHFALNDGPTMEKILQRCRAKQE